MPSTVIRASSIGSMTSFSMTSGAAPSQDRRTLTTGESTSGFCDTPSRKNDKPPNSRRQSMIIQAKTGFLMATSERVT